MTELIDDRYELLEVIASGGMATVWRARDTRLDRVVALKRPHPTPDSDEAIHRRMDREARAAASLNHPNVVTVYDYGNDDEGPFLVMELAEGPTLDQVAPEIGAPAVTEIGVQLAEALAAIHAAGIVHRDVKPANVIMSERGPLLTDFGIAFSPGTTSQITDPGKIVVTPSYAAPEVLAGGSPTPAADVYALAVVVAELFNGEPMFAGFERPPVPPLSDPHLARVIGPALSDDPAQRPTAAAFAAGLRGAAPTMSTVPAPVPGEPTLVMDTPVAAGVSRPQPSSTTPAAARRSGWAWLMSGLLVGALLFLLATRGPAGGDDPGAITTSSAAPVTTTTTAPPTTTTVATTTTTVPPTTTTSVVDEVAQARDDLEAILLEPPRDDLSQSEVEEIMDRVDEAIAAAGEGDEREAKELLRDVARELDERLRGRGERRRAEDALEELADLLGVSLSDDEDD